MLKQTFFILQNDIWVSPKKRTYDNFARYGNDQITKISYLCHSKT